MSSIEDDTLSNLYNWLDTIPFSRPKKNLARDFSDATLAAELVKNYFPGMVDVHNYPPTSTMENKRINWSVLNHKVLKKMEFPLTGATINELSMAKRGTTEDFLSNLREKINQLMEKKIAATKTKKMADIESKLSAYSSSLKGGSEICRTKSPSVRAEAGHRVARSLIERVRRNKKNISLPDLSADKRNFLRSPPTGVMFDFNFDSMYPVAKVMLKEDSSLEKMRFEIVPKLINEENFWRNYFYRVQLVKNSSRLSKIAKQKNSSGSSLSSESNESIKGMDKTTVEGGPDSDATDSPNHEFVSDAFQSSCVSEEDIKHGMKMLGVTEKGAKDDDWEKEMQQELQEYEVVAEGNDDDPDWENEIEKMLGDKVKDVV